jgi:hypothetical protein
MWRPLTSATVSAPTIPSWPGNWPAPPSGPSGTAIAVGAASDDSAGSAR